MAVSNVNALLAGAYPRRWGKYRSTTLTRTRGYLGTLWALPGFPGPGSYSSDINGATLSGATSGALAFDNPASGETRLTRMTISIARGEVIYLCDRLWHNGAIDETINTSQAIVSPTWPARDANGSTDGAGVLLALEVSTATGAGTPVVTTTYTNSAGTGSRTGEFTGLTTSEVTSTYMIPLQAGDAGVRSVQSIQFSVTWTSGVTNLVAYRPLCSLACVAIVGGAHEIGPLSTGMPRIYDDSVLYFMTKGIDSSSATGMGGTVQWVQS